MKKAKEISILLVAVASMLLMSIEVFAADREALLNATVFVKQIFAIEATPLSIDFGSLEPGPDSITGAKDLSIFCETNNNNPWEVSIALTSPLSSGMFTIPNGSFLWRGKSSGSGTWHIQAGHLDTTPLTLYSSGNDEFITPSPVELNLQFEVNIPTNQAAGEYSATVLVKMKDTSTNQEIITDPVSITLKVKPRFTMSVSPSSLEFGRVEPGQATESEELYIACSTNNNNPWNVSIHAISELTSEIFTIPNENFRWRYKETGYGTSMDTAPFVFYKCSIDEYITPTPVELYLTFNVNIPPTQPVGRYRTTLVLTMTEAGEPTPSH